MDSNVSSQERLQSVAERVQQLARAQGADQAEVSASQDDGFRVTIRQGELETLEYHCGTQLALTVYCGKKSASVTSTDFADDFLPTLVNRACAMASHMEEDVYAGLANPALMATSFPDLSLDHPWNITPDQAKDLAIACEEKAKSLDPRIINSEGVAVSTGRSDHLYANSHGFRGYTRSTCHSCSCILIAEADGKKERDFSYTVARDPSDLLSLTELASLAAQKTVGRLGACKKKTQKTPVIFSAEMARSLMAEFLSAISGAAIYQRASFLCDAIGTQVFSKQVRIYENPFLPKGLGSASFDTEGVMTRAQDFICDGILVRYLLSSYAARRLGMQETGNADGIHNGFVSARKKSFNELLREMNTGFLVTELAGQGVNYVTGDYSRGAVGYWVEGGNIQYPISGMTISGNLKDMFLNLVAVGDDIDRNGNIQTGSILLEEMMMAGEG